MKNVLLVNQSTVVSAADLAKTANALQQQVTKHFAPLWGMWAGIYYDVKAWPGFDLLYILDNTDQADALGYHTLALKELIQGFVFAKTDAAAGVPWSLTASHELLEMLVNPYVDRLVSGPYQSKPALRPEEVADPTEGSSYTINGVSVSNFVTPAWFQPDSTSGPYDYLGRIAHPLQLDSGGYIPVSTSIDQWVYVFGQKAAVGHMKQDRSQSYSRPSRMMARLGGSSAQQPPPGTVTDDPVQGMFSSTDWKLNYIIGMLNNLGATISQIAAAISDLGGGNVDPAAIAALAAKLKAPTDDLGKSVAVNQPKPSK